MAASHAVAELAGEFGVEDQRTGGVLIIDEAPFDSTMLRGLTESRWSVYEAHSEAEALQRADATPLDVVLIEQRALGRSWVELIERLGRCQPGVAGIVLTAQAEGEVVEAAFRRADVFRFLRKPLASEEILHAVQQASDQAAQRRTIERLVELLARRTDELHRSLDQQREQHALLLHLERLGTVGRLASGITHDLKNVMVALRSVDEELVERAVDPELCEVMRLSLGSVDSLLHQLQAVHEYARSGSVALQIESVEVAAVVDAAIAIVRADAHFRQGRVACSVEPDLPPVRVDRQKMTQVFVNLLRNALHASDRGTEVSISARALDSGEVEVAVEDDGPGIPREVRARLFEPFVSTKGEQGLGLGLYMSRLIVETHHGHITLADRVAPGARFEIVLPSGARDLPCRRRESASRVENAL